MFAVRLPVVQIVDTLQAELHSSTLHKKCRICNICFRKVLRVALMIKDPPSANSKSVQFFWVHFKSTVIRCELFIIYLT